MVPFGRWLVDRFNLLPTWQRVKNAKGGGAHRTPPLSALSLAPAHSFIVATLDGLIGVAPESAGLDAVGPAVVHVVVDEDGEFAVDAGGG